jgi:microsomal epoxide hydrolase
MRERELHMESFKIEIPESDLDDLRSRLAATRWPSEISGAGWDRGVPLDYLKELAEYWRTSFDWRAAEARINRFPQYVTEIDGQRIHFIHVRSPEPDAVPVVMTHGWPGSIAEFLDVIEPLTDPRAHGGDPATAVHLVVPSLPGYGFSGPVTEPGWNMVRTASAWAQLMASLGYDSYVTQGGDFGAFLSLTLAGVDFQHVRAAHVNLLVTPPNGDPTELAELTGEEQARLGALMRYVTELTGYMKVQATRPQTLSYALTDSPVGQLAWIIEKFKEWTDSDKVPEDAVDRDLLLTNASIYWHTGTAASSANFYYEVADTLPTAPTPPPAMPPLPTPLGVAVYPRELTPPIRRFADRGFPNIIHWREYDRGGHFAALEEPDLFVADLREFIQALPR